MCLWTCMCVWWLCRALCTLVQGVCMHACVCGVCACALSYYVRFRVHTLAECHWIQNPNPKPSPKPNPVPNPKPNWLHDLKACERGCETDVSLNYALQHTYSTACASNLCLMCRPAIFLLRQLPDKHGITPLLAAVWEGHLDAVRVLISKVGATHITSYICTYCCVPSGYTHTHAYSVIHTHTHTHTHAHTHMMLHVFLSEWSWVVTLISIYLSDVIVLYYGDYMACVW